MEIMYEILESPDNEYDIYVLSCKKIYENIDSHKIEIKFELKNDDLCEINDKILDIRINGKYFDVLSKTNGLLIIDNKFNYSYDKLTDHTTNFKILDGEEIFRIKKNVNEREINVPIIEEDRFNKIHTLKWIKLGGNNFRYFEKKLRGFFLTKTNTNQLLFFSINNINGRDYIVINHRAKDYDIKAGDKFLILLDNDEIINLSFENNSYLLYESDAEYYTEKLKKIKENKVILTIKDLNSLVNNKIVDWKLSLQTGQELSGIIPIEPKYCKVGYKSFTKFQEQILLMFKIYLNDVNIIKGYEPIEDYNELNPEIKKEKCFLYLMVDTTNGYYKIGISNKPFYREKTLQSEKPTIELIVTKVFPTRKITESIEKALHKAYSEKNIRGEWFNLSEEDVDDIITTLK